ncbi:MAG: hypothetical protein K8S87_11245 [Planctomycetes bacterium]|nr:hypothetical protein [Planctomycetota bacterium]
MAEKGNLERLSEKADQAIKRNNYDYAIQILQQLLKMDPDNAKGNTLYFQAVQKKWQKIGKKPKPGKMLLKLKGLFTFKKWEALIDRAREDHITDPDNTKILEFLAEALMWQKHFNAVYATCKRFTELDPKHVLAWFWLSKALKELGKIDEAMNSVTKAMDLDNTNKSISDFYRDLSARQTMDKKKLADAKSFIDVVDKEEVQKAIQKDKKLTKEELEANIKRLGGLEGVKTYKDATSIGEYFAELDDYASAVKAYKLAYEMNNTVVEMLDKAGDYTIKHYQKKVRESKAKGLADKEAEFTKKLKEYQIQEFQRRVYARPTDLVLKYKLGTFLYHAHLYKEAVRELQAAKKDLKQQSDCELMLGRCFLELESFDLAERTLNGLVKTVGLKEEKKKETLYWLGHTYFKKNDKVKAKDIWMDIQAIDYDYKDVDVMIKQC